jgi:hypothetical protein
LHRTLEDLVKIGLGDLINDHVVNGKVPTDSDLLQEARKIILETNVVSNMPEDAEVSWFQDLIMLSGNSQDCKSVGNLRSAGLSWAQKLEMMNSEVPLKDSTDLTTINCSKDRALKSFVNARLALGLTATDSELQVEACRILDEIEKTSNFKCKGAVSWFKYLITSSTSWLAPFRRRSGLPRSSDMADEHIRNPDESTIDYSIHNHTRLENELKEFIRLQLALGVAPSDSDLQRQARLIIYKNDDPWNQTAMDEPAMLHLFKRQNGLAPTNEDGPDLPPLSKAGEIGLSQLIQTPASLSPSKTLHWDLEDTAPTPNHDQPLHTLIQNQPSTNTNPTLPLRYFLNDANCYSRLVRELSRFVTSCMSPNNPNQHVSLALNGLVYVDIDFPTDSIRCRDPKPSPLGDL